MARKENKSGIPHEDRTATEPRSEALHDVILHKIQNVNESIKLYKLQIKDARKGVKVSLQPLAPDPRTRSRVRVTCGSTSLTMPYQ